jgi:hypothetical protein
MVVVAASTRGVNWELVTTMLQFLLLAGVPCDSARAQ